MMGSAIKDSFVAVDEKKYKIIPHTQGYCTKCENYVPICIRKLTWLKIILILAWVFGDILLISGISLTTISIYHKYDYYAPNEFQLEDAGIPILVVGIILIVIAIAATIIYNIWPMWATKKFPKYWLCPHCLLPIKSNIDFAKKRDEREIKKTEKTSFAQSYGSTLGEQKANYDAKMYFNNQNNNSLEYNTNNVNNNIKSSSTPNNNVNNSELTKRLNEITNLRNNNYISKQEYQQLKKNILDNFSKQS